MNELMKEKIMGWWRGR